MARSMASDEGVKPRFSTPCAPRNVALVSDRSSSSGPEDTSACPACWVANEGVAGRLSGSGGLAGLARGGRLMAALFAEDGGGGGVPLNPAALFIGGGGLALHPAELFSGRRWGPLPVGKGGGLAGFSCTGSACWRPGSPEGAAPGDSTLTRPTETNSPNGRRQRTRPFAPISPKARTASPSWTDAPGSTSN